MMEALAIPGWNTPPRTVDDWLDGLAASGWNAAAEADEDNDLWIEVSGLRLRGLVEKDAGSVASIHFELYEPDPAPAMQLIERVADQLGWEIHLDEDDEDED